MIAHTGYEAITLDLQHGLIDDQTAVTMLQAISTTAAVPLVRLPWNDPAAIMRALDAGAYGVICPMINTRAEAEAFVGACRYPPLGYRSYGPIRATIYAGDDYYHHANNTVLALALIETAEALANVEDIVTPPGLDGLYIGTVDLSISLGLIGLGDLDDPRLRQAIDHILDAARRQDRIVAMHAVNPQQAAMLAGMGIQLLTVLTDSAVLQAGATDLLARTRAFIET
ncbi:MAG: aldolase/citrate lyase family protein [Chloroflexota bacterium]